MLDLSKVLASNFTAQLSDQGELPSASVHVPGQTIAPSGTVTAEIDIILPRQELLVTLRVQYAGVTYSNFGNYWIYVPNQTLLNPPNAATYAVFSNRLGTTLRIGLSYQAGSGGHVLQDHTVTAIAHTYLMPF